MPGSHEGLSPAWDRPPDDVYEELASHDEDMVRAEYEHLTRSDRPGSYRTAPATVARAQRRDGPAREKARR
jgi:hypothetical protein